MSKIINYELKSRNVIKTYTTRIINGNGDKNIFIKNKNRCIYDENNIKIMYINGGNK